MDIRNILENINFSFQPIVNVITGETLGISILPINYEKLGFNLLTELFEEFYNKNDLLELNNKLNEKVFKEIQKLKKNDLLLFCNINDRIINYIIKNFETIKKKIRSYEFLNNKTNNKIFFEIKGKKHKKNLKNLKLIIKFFKKMNYNIVIDNYIINVDGLNILYDNDINFLKINKSFIKNIDKDYKKQIFIEYIIKIFHLLDIKVIVSGIKTKEEFLTCRNLNVDYVQGSFIQKYTTNIKEIKNNYNNIFKEFENENKQKNIELEEKIIEYIEPTNINSDINEILEKIKQDPFIEIIPIINDAGEFLGVCNKKEIIKILITPYGYNLLQNKKTKISSFLIPFFSIDKNTDIDTILKLYTKRKDNQHGVVVTSNKKYIGYIKDQTIIELSYKKNLEYAQDLNPLTKLPGNKKINEFIQESIKFANTKQKYYICYIDLDNFKPFNDKYGFIKGDRILTLFANILKKELLSDNTFIGHIGGDDFFVGFKTNDYIFVYNQILKIIKKFKNNVLDFYDKKDKEKGFLLGKDREGNLKKFPFLTASAIIVEINNNITKKEIDEILQKTKTISKKNNFPIFVSINKFN